MAQYYIGRDNQRLGPFEVHQLLANGLTPDSLVWCNGMAGWQMAKDVPELSGLFVAQQPQYQQLQYEQTQYGGGYQQPQYGGYQQPQYQQQYQQPQWQVLISNPGVVPTGRKLTCLSWQIKTTSLPRKFLTFRRDCRWLMTIH